MDMQALLNAVASGPPPNIPTGVNRVPVPQITLPGIGQVPVPNVPTAPPPVVPGQPLPTGPGAGVGGIAQKLGNLVPAAAGGAGNVIGSQTGPTPTAQIAGPRGDRTFLSNIPSPAPPYQAKAFDVLRPGGQGQAPTPTQQHMAASTGYTGGHAPGQYEGWLAAQPPQVRQAAHTAFSQASMMAPAATPIRQQAFGALMAPRTAQRAAPQRQLVGPNQARRNA